MKPRSMSKFFLFLLMKTSVVFLTFLEGSNCTNSSNDVNSSRFDDVISVPFYLRGPVAESQQPSVDANLSLLLQESHLFHGRTLVVTSVFTNRTGVNGEVITQVLPTVTVDGYQLTNHRIAALLRLLRDKFEEFVDYSTYTGELVEPQSEDGLSLSLYVLFFVLMMVINVLVVFFLTKGLRYRRTEGINLVTMNSQTTSQDTLNTSSVPKRSSVVGICNNLAYAGDDLGQELSAPYVIQVSCDTNSALP